MKKWIFLTLLFGFGACYAAAPPAKPQIIQPAGRYQIYETEHATYLLDSTTGSVWRAVNCNSPPPEGITPSNAFKMGLAMSCWEQNVFFGAAGSGDKTIKTRP